MSIVAPEHWPAIVAHCIELSSGCLVWRGPDRVCVAGRAIRPHRAAWEAAYGGTPPRLVRMCATAGCVAPSHSRSARKTIQSHVKEMMDRVDRSGGPDACWPWTGPRDHKGYGRVGRSHKAHRLAWESVNGPIPQMPGHHGACVLHRCDEPPCCNPAHLFLGTNRDNVADMKRKGRMVSRDALRGKEELAASLVATGGTFRSIAKELGVSHHTVSKFARR